jgi:hypothetical protein
VTAFAAVQGAVDALQQEMDEMMADPNRDAAHLGPVILSKIGELAVKQEQARELAMRSGLLQQARMLEEAAVEATALAAAGGVTPTI